MTSFSYYELVDCFSAYNCPITCLRDYIFISSWFFSSDKEAFNVCIYKESFSSSDTFDYLCYDNLVYKLIHFSCSIANYLSNNETRFMYED